MRALRARLGDREAESGDGLLEKRELGDGERDMDRDRDRERDRDRCPPLSRFPRPRPDRLPLTIREPDLPEPARTSPGVSLLPESEAAERNPDAEMRTDVSAAST